MSTEALFNLAVLYYFIQNRKSEPEIERHRERTLSELEEARRQPSINTSESQFPVFADVPKKEEAPFQPQLQHLSALTMDFSQDQNN